MARFSRATRVEDVTRVAVVSPGEQMPFPGVAALFPHLQFDTVGATWPDRPPSGYELLIAPVDGASAVEIDSAVRRLRAMPAELRVIVVLQHADIATTRLLLREGAADVLAGPVTETALAVTLDKLLGPAAAAAGGPGGQIVAVLKAGGGVGATTLCVQAGAMAAQAGASVCLADLDLQFGASSLYLDMPNSATVSDCMSAGPRVAEIDFAGLLGKHRSGLNLLAAPRQVTPLEALTPAHTEALLTALKSRYELVLVDLPSVWTAWTNRVLQLADRIVIVSHLSVPHMHMVDRQLSTLRTQGLDDRRVALVCNALGPERTATLSVKAAERALGRGFDVIVPEDRKLMFAAINQGVELSALRRGAKIEKAIGDLVRLLVPQTTGPQPTGPQPTGEAAKVRRH
jgi:pilus assembly protein CpaE